MDQASAIAFIAKFAAGDYTRAEHQEFLGWLAQAPEAELDPVLNAWSELTASEQPADAGLVARIEAVIDEYQQEQEAPRPLYGRLTRFTAAAAVIILFAGATWLWLRPTEKSSIAVRSSTSVHDVLPGGNKAILTLSGGQQIILDSAHNGQLASQGSTQIIKTDSGRLSYNPIPKSQNQTSAILYNTLSTPRGGQYQLTLPDGTKVWLNAASSIRFPVAFARDEREVEISGEAYFKIAPLASKPFRVSITGATPQLVEVLGTQFDVLAYDDEPEVRTTLLAGVVRVSRKVGKIVLHPGEQARIAHNESGQQLRLVKGIDTAQAIAWTTGFFQFSDLDLPTMLRQLSRWYDIDIDNQAGTQGSHHRISGRIRRSLPLSKILQLLQSMDVHAKIENRTLIILP